MNRGQESRRFLAVVKEIEEEFMNLEDKKKQPELQESIS